MFKFLLISFLILNSSLSFAMHTVAPNVRVFYLWTNDNPGKSHYKRLINGHNCSNIWSEIMDNAKSDNFRSTGVHEAVYLAGNPIDSLGYGTKLVEVHALTDITQITQYPNAQNPAITWYMATKPDGIYFHKFSGKGINTHDIIKYYASTNTTYNGDVSRLQIYLDRILLERSDNNFNLIQNQHPILLSHGFVINRGFEINLKGGLIISNIDTNKNVELVYTMNNWISSRTVRVHFNKSLDNGKELWSFSVDGIQKYQQHYFQGYFKLNANNQTYFENNMGRNFKAENFPETKRF